ncbi:zinc-binding dehydrogenase [Streptomyces sp. JNUCC 64]
MVAGASGAVGRFAVQLAARGGAHVVAVARKPELADELRALGADEAVTDPEAVTGPVDGVLDQVGGPGLARAFDALGEGGTLVLTGAASGAATAFPPGALLADPLRQDRSIVTFFEMTGSGPPGPVRLPPPSGRTGPAPHDPGPDPSGSAHRPLPAARRPLNRPALVARPWSPAPHRGDRLDSLVRPGPTSPSKNPRSRKKRT